MDSIAILNTPGVTEGTFVDISLTFSEETGSQPVIGQAGSGNGVKEPHSEACFCCFRYSYDPFTSVTGVLAWTTSRTLHVTYIKDIAHLCLSAVFNYCHKDIYMMYCTYEARFHTC